MAGILAIVGGFVYGLAGVAMGAGNLRWVGWSADANPYFIGLGLGLAFVVLAFAIARGRDMSGTAGIEGRVVAGSASR